MANILLFYDKPHKLISSIIRVYSLVIPVKALLNSPVPTEHSSLLYVRPLQNKG